MKRITWNSFFKTFWFPLIQLPRKSEVEEELAEIKEAWQFPLIQLPRKSEAFPLFVGICAFHVSINSTSEEVRSHARIWACFLIFLVSINSTSEEVRSNDWFSATPTPGEVSINSTSEEVRRDLIDRPTWPQGEGFPLIQLPRKSEEDAAYKAIKAYIPVSINSTSEEVRRLKAVYTGGSVPRVSINSTSEEVRSRDGKKCLVPSIGRFPLIQLPRKSEEKLSIYNLTAFPGFH